MKVCDAIAQWLARRNIEIGFGIIGGGNVALWDAIARLAKTQIIPTHHEQAASMAASYYARTSSRLGLAIVTTGAGSANALTGVLAAHMDGTPLLVLSGNEPSMHMGSPCRVWGVQGFDSSGTAAHLAKAAKRLMKPAKVIYELEWAADFALCAPQGPVWIDLPKDIQNAEI